MTQAPGPDRRQFPRLRAEVFVRPLALRDRLRMRRVNDVSLTGARAYSDEDRRPGEQLELEIQRESEPPIVVVAEVVWVEQLPGGSPARFDVGFRFVGGRAALDALSRILEPSSGD